MLLKNHFKKQCVYLIWNQFVTNKYVQYLIGIYWFKMTYAYQTSK